MANEYRVSLADLYGDPRLRRRGNLFGNPDLTEDSFVASTSTANPIYAKSYTTTQEEAALREQQRKQRRQQQQSNVIGQASNLALGYQAGANAASSAAVPTVTAASSAPTAVAADSLVVAPGAQVPAGYVAVGTAENGGTLVAADSAAGGSYAGLAAGLYGTYKLGQNIADGKRDRKGGAAQGAVAGAGYGSYVAGPYGAAVGAIIGGLVGLAGGSLKAGKHDDQIRRDTIRQNLKSAGAVDEDYNVRLADGTRYNIGVDGGAELANKQGGVRRAYETDETNSLTPQAIAYTNPLAAIVASGDPKLRSDQAGYYTNAITSNAATAEDARKNAIALYQDHGVDYYTAHSEIDRLVTEGKIDKSTAAAYHEGINQTFNFYGDSQKKSRVGGLPTGPRIGGEEERGRGRGRPSIDDLLPEIKVPGSFSTPDEQPSAEEQASVDRYLEEYSKTLRRGGSAAGRNRRN